MTDDTTTISAEALRRLQVEAAFARGERIEMRWADRIDPADPWEYAPHPAWDWANFDHRIARPIAPKRTAADICTEIDKLLAELRSVTE